MGHMALWMAQVLGDVGPESHINHPKRSTYVVTDKEKEQLHLKTPAHTRSLHPLMSSRNTNLPTETRPWPAHSSQPSNTDNSKRRRCEMPCQMVHEISRNFTMKDTIKIMDQLILRSQGNLEQYRLDSDLILQHCVAIVKDLQKEMFTHANGRRLQWRPMKAAWFDALVFDTHFGGQNCLSVAQALQAQLGNLMAVRQNLRIQNRCLLASVSD